jgi:hypothetical protein
MFITGKPGFIVCSDAVDIWRRHSGGEVHIGLLRTLEKAREQITGTFDAVAIDNRIKRVEPFLSLSRISVGELVH